MGRSHGMRKFFVGQQEASRVSHVLGHWRHNGRQGRSRREETRHGRAARGNSSEALDRLPSDQPQRAADLIAQRVNAIELMLADSGWGRALYLELIWPDQGRLMSKSEERWMPRDIPDDLKVRQYSEAVRSHRHTTGKGPGEGRGRGVPPPQTEVKIGEPQMQRRRREGNAGQGERRMRQVSQVVESPLGSLSAAVSAFTALDKLMSASSQATVDGDVNRSPVGSCGRGDARPCADLWVPCLPLRCW